MKQFMLYGSEKKNRVEVPSYLRQTYDKIVAGAGEAAVLLVYGSPDAWSTDFKVTAPAKIELALEDVAIVLIPKDSGSLKITWSERGQSRSVTYGFNGENLVPVY